MDNDDFILEAVVAEVANTKPLTPSEQYALGVKLEELLATPVGRPKKEKVDFCHNFQNGRTRDKVGAVLGLSGKTWEKLKAIQESPYDDLKKELEGHGKVAKVYFTLLQRHQAEEIAQEPLSDLPLGRIICDDCLNVLPSIAANTFPATVTDPPFGIGFKYGKKREPCQNPADYWNWFDPIYRQIYRVTRPGGLIALWQPTEYLPFFWRWYGNDIRIFIAAKDCVQIHPGSPLTPAYDPIVMLWKPGAKPLLPVQERSMNFFVSRMDFDDLAKLHPCPRPLDLCVNIIRNFTIENGTVLDCFAGSGSIPLAVQKVDGGRRFVGIEQREDYCHIANRRLVLG